MHELTSYDTHRPCKMTSTQKCSIEAMKLWLTRTLGNKIDRRQLNHTNDPIRSESCVFGHRSWTSSFLYSTPLFIQIISDLYALVWRQLQGHIASTSAPFGTSNKRIHAAIKRNLQMRTHACPCARAGEHLSNTRPHGNLLFYTVYPYLGTTQKEIHTHLLITQL
jgi:hypothetical protein